MHQLLLSYLNSQHGDDPIGFSLLRATGSSFIVLVSFVWGVFIFHEHVHSRFSACLAILSMMLGLFGMSYYSSPEAAAVDSSSDQLRNVPAEPQHIIQPGTTYGGVYQGLAGCGDEEEDALPITTADNDDDGLEEFMKQPRLTERTATSTAAWSTSESSCASDSPDHLLDRDSDVGQQEETLTFASGCDENAHMSPSSMSESPLSSEVVMVNVCGHPIRKRKLGMLSAAFCGLYGGSIMAPMKFCRADTKGTHYLMSFSIGASIVTVALWLCRYLFHVSRQRSLTKAYHALPCFHLRVMWLAGGVSGLLWSIGNFFSLLSVFYLGEGVGYPLVQTSILVSGLWGIFYFKEVQGRERITKWFLSSLMTVFGILLLSYEHHEK